MPTPTYTPLATVTLTSTASSVTFSSIPQTYRDLILILEGKNSAENDVRLQVNNDTGSNYSWLRMLGNGSTTNSTFTIPDTYAALSRGARPTSTVPVLIYATIIDYAQTNKHKSVLSRANHAVNGTEALSSRWANTSALTSIKIEVFGGQWASGSTFSLYGIIA